MFSSTESKSNQMEALAEQRHLVDAYFEQLREEVSRVLIRDAGSIEEIKALKSRLSAYERAFQNLESDHVKTEHSLQVAEKENEDLRLQLKGHRVVALLDGDGTIFSGRFLELGQSGGLAAARQLTDCILQYLQKNFGTSNYQLSVYVFLNKRGLMGALGRMPAYRISEGQFDDFIMGFNQASERFLMVDVGNSKEAADSKIKVHLEDEIRLPQTFKIIFGGCHDNGYVNTLRSQITAGFTDKLLLLKSYSEMAAGISALDLPTLEIPELFMAQKLGMALPALHTTDRLLERGRSYSASSVLSPRSQSHVPHTRDSHEVSAAVDQKSSSTGMIIPAEPVRPLVKTQATAPATYSIAVSSGARRAPTPELDSSSDSTSDATASEADWSGEASVDLHPSFTSSKSRSIDPSIPLSKHKPPPCTLFYLASCKHGADCRYAHDYILNAEHYDEIRVNAKKAPCPSVNKDETCTWAENCCYGHYCPQGPKCPFLKQGRCKFTGVDMHKLPAQKSG